MELEPQSFIWAPCAQLYSIAETPSLPHLGTYTRALLASQDRRHLFVTPPLGIIDSKHVAVSWRQKEGPGWGDILGFSKQFLLPSD